MSRNPLVAAEIAVLLALALVLLGNSDVSCNTGPATGPTLLESPSYEGKTQIYNTFVDDGLGLGTSIDSGSVSAGAANPLVLSQTAVNDVSAQLALATDADTFTVDCTHIPTGDSTTQCLATLRATFPIAETGGDAHFDVQLVEIVDEASNVGTLLAEVEIECGSTLRIADLEGAQTSLGKPSRMRLDVPVDPSATECTVVVRNASSELNAIVPSPPIGLENLHSIRVSAIYIDPIECTDNSECPGTLPFCDPNSQTCHEGGTADGCLVHSLHCDGTTHPYCTGQNFLGFLGCATGKQSPCSYDGQCASSHFCNFSFCEPLVPVTDPAGCDADQTWVYGNDCLDGDEGKYGSGCWDGFGCEPAGGGVDNGVCQGHVCIGFVPTGSDCAPTYLQCENGDYCADATKTCQPRLPEGSPCTENVACQNYPISHSCIGGVCAPRSGSGGPCDPSDVIDIDCQSNSCDDATGTCF